MEKRPWALGGPPIAILGLGVAIRLKVLGDDLSHLNLLMISNVLFALAGLWIVALTVNWLWSLRSPKPDPPPMPPDRQVMAQALLWLSDKSAWGRWFRMQNLANDDQDLSESSFMHVAITVLREATKNGDLAVWGVPSGGAGYEPISPELLQTRATFYVEPDLRQLWRVRLGPYTGSTPEVVALLPKFDWIAVDMNEVKRIWPERDRSADKKTAKLEKKHLKRAGR